jgi:hypothetical protein
LIRFDAAFLLRQHGNEACSSLNTAGRARKALEA